MGNGFIVGNVSESDLDEVDNIDLFVFVESCLMYFIKFEFFFGEYVWYCGNCLKLLLEERWKMRKFKIVLVV